MTRIQFCLLQLECRNRYRKKSCSMPQFHNLLFGDSGAELKSLELHPLLENLLQKIIKGLKWRNFKISNSDHF